MPQARSTGAGQGRPRRHHRARTDDRSCRVGEAWRRPADGHVDRTSPPSRRGAVAAWCALGRGGRERRRPTGRLLGHVRRAQPTTRRNTTHRLIETAEDAARRRGRGREELTAMGIGCCRAEPGAGTPLAGTGTAGGHQVVGVRVIRGGHGLSTLYIGGGWWRLAVRYPVRDGLAKGPRMLGTGLWAPPKGRDGSATPSNASSQLPCLAVGWTFEPPSVERSSLCGDPSRLRGLGHDYRPQRCLESSRGRVPTVVRCVPAKGQASTSSTVTMTMSWSKCRP